MGRRAEVVSPVDVMPEREERARVTVARMVRLQHAIPGDVRPWEVRREIRLKLGASASSVEVAEQTMKALGLSAEYLSALKARGFE